ncbi:MAG: ketopantoate reductase family protein [Candidatus Latescibacteria bacterium]|jgi:2-dehydropantoate 2-reductase|nr:ketopantoate reductase family protein [Candidatus Latescibacterota bacterium]
MRILVFGAGAVGQAVGCILAADGHNVDLIVRERFTETLRAHGLAVTGIFGDYKVESENIGVYSDITDVIRNRYDYVLITTKSYDTGAAVTELEKISSQNFTIVSMQNGCGNLETIIGRFREARSLGARIITGFEIESPCLVRITVSADDIHIGGFKEGAIPTTVPPIVEAINNAGLPCVTTLFIKRDLFAKLLYNCALNPLGAALGVHYGALGDDPDTREIMNITIREVFAVIEAMGGKTHWDHAEEYQTFFYEKQIPATYNHRPSMLQDLEMGKRTEVEALTGYVSLHGRLYGVLTPVCDTLSNIIRFKEGNSIK